MAQDDQSTAIQSSGLNIPKEVEEKFPQYVKLIKVSQSMNDEERQYWIDVLPIMTEDQLENLQSILDNEQKQLKEVESEYEEGVQEEVKHFNLEFDELKYKEKKRMRREAEKQHEIEEQEHEEAILAELANL